MRLLYAFITKIRFYSWRPWNIELEFFLPLVERLRIYLFIFSFFTALMCPWSFQKKFQPQIMLSFHLTSAALERASPSSYVNMLLVCKSDILKSIARGRGLVGPDKWLSSTAVRNNKWLPKTFDQRDQSKYGVILHHLKKKSKFKWFIILPGIVMMIFTTPVPTKSGHWVNQACSVQLGAMGNFSVCRLSLWAGVKIIAT